MAPDGKVDWDQVTQERTRLLEEIKDLRKQIREKKLEIDALPKRGKGKPQGTIVRTESIRHTRYATIRAYDMIQKWRRIETKKGHIFKKENKLPPEEIMHPIITKACEKWPRASSEEVRNKINRINADPENRVVSGGLLYRVRDTEWLDRSDDFFDV